jgi:hypothetical protein
VQHLSFADKAECTCVFRGIFGRDRMTPTMQRKNGGMANGERPSPFEEEIPCTVYEGEMGPQREQLQQAATLFRSPSRAVLQLQLKVAQFWYRQARWGLIENSRLQTQWSTICENTFHFSLEAFHVVVFSWSLEVASSCCRLCRIPHLCQYFEKAKRD